MKKFVRPTFLLTREPEEFDEAEVVASYQHCAAVVGIYRVHVSDVGIFGPDAVYFCPDDTCPSHPVDPLCLLLRNQLPCCRTQEEVQRLEVERSGVSGDK